MRLGIGKCNLDYNPYRKIVQFGDLVFDTEDIVLDSTYSASTKTSSTSYAWGNGSYVPFKKQSQLWNEADMSMQATFDYGLYREEDRRYLKDWVLTELAKPSKIWAVDGHRLLWAYAYLTNYSEAYQEYKGTFSMDLDFKIPEGTWHIADAHSTFLIPWDSCDFSNNEDYRDPHYCDNCCTTCNEGNVDCPTCLADCGKVEKEDSLCTNHSPDIFAQFMKCGHSWKIVYDCNRGKCLFGDEAWGTRICKKDTCKEVIAGQFWSNTTLDTTNVDVILTGSWQNPSITINDNTMTLEGDYEGYIHFYADGTVTTQCDGCSQEEDVDISKLTVSDELGWTIHHGNNRVIIHGACDCGDNCAYIKADELTI